MWSIHAHCKCKLFHLPPHTPGNFILHKRRLRWVQVPYRDLRLCSAHVHSPEHRLPSVRRHLLSITKQQCHRTVPFPVHRHQSHTPCLTVSTDKYSSHFHWHLYFSLKVTVQEGLGARASAGACGIPWKHSQSGLPCSGMCWPLPLPFTNEWAINGAFHEEPK